MTEPTVRMSDDAVRAAIERRAPGHADRALLDRIIRSTEATPQVAGVGRLIPLLMPPRPGRWAVLAAAALVVLAILAAGLIAGAVPPAPPRLAVSPTAPPQAAVVPVPASTGAPSPEASADASPAPVCPSSAARILTGAAMPAGRQPPAHVGAQVDLGVYVTLSEATGMADEIWAVAGGGEAHRIGVLDGAGNGVRVEDVSADGALAIVSVGHWSPSGASVECFDLFALKTDGSSAWRLTGSGPYEDALGARISPDGRWVAWTSSAFTAGAASIRLMDLDTQGSRPIEVACDPTATLAKAWAPSGGQLAADCGSRIVFADTTGGSASFALPAADPVQALDWQSPGELLVATTPSVNAAAPVDTWAIDPASPPASPPAFTHRWTSTPPFILVQDDQGSPMSAAAHEMVVQVSTASGDFPWYVVDLVDGRSRQISDPTGIDAQLHPTIGGGEGTASVVVGDGQATRRLMAVDLATLKRTTIGTLPSAYAQGRWRLR